MTHYSSLRSLMISMFILLVICQIHSQEITLIDQNLNNNWALFRDRIIGASDAAVYFRMNTSFDLNLYYSDGTNANTQATGYVFTDDFPASDVTLRAGSGDKIAFGITGSTRDIILFPGNTADFLTLETGVYRSYYTFAYNNPNPRRVNITSAGTKAYFWYQNVGSPNSLYVTDGTEAGTQVLIDDMDFYDEFNYLDNTLILGVDGQLVFRGRAISEPSSSGGLYYTDGTILNTRRINIGNTVDTSPKDFTYLEGAFYFVADTDEGRRLLTTDGTLPGTVVVADQEVNEMIQYNGKLFAGAEVGGVGNELAYWVPGDQSFQLAYDLHHIWSSALSQKLLPGIPPLIPPPAATSCTNF